MSDGDGTADVAFAAGVATATAEQATNDAAEAEARAELAEARADNAEATATAAVEASWATRDELAVLQARVDELAAAGRTKDDGEPAAPAPESRQDAAAVVEPAADTGKGSTGGSGGKKKRRGWFE